MTGSRVRPRVLVGLFLALLAIALQGVQGEEVLADQVPSEVQCRPYIEKALKGVGTGSFEESSIEVGDDTNNQEPPLNEQDDDDDDDGNDEDDEAGRIPNDSSAVEDVGDSDGVGNDDDDEQNSGEDEAEPAAGEEAQEEHVGTVASNEKDDDGVETVEVTSVENVENETVEDDDEDDDDNGGDDNDDNEEEENAEEVDVGDEEQDDESAIESIEAQEDDDEEDDEGNTEQEGDTAENRKDGSEEDAAAIGESEENEAGSVEGDAEDGDSVENRTEENDEEAENDSKDDDDGDSEINEIEETNLGDDVEPDDASDDAASLESVAQEENEGDDDHAKEETDDDDDDKKDEDGDSKEDTEEDIEESVKETTEDVNEESIEEQPASTGTEASREDDGKSDETEEVKSRDRRDVEEEPEQEGEAEDDKDGGSEEAENVASAEKSEASKDENTTEPTPEEDLIQEIEVPENLRPRDHINQLLKVDEENEVKERAIQRAADIVLRDLKRLYDNAIKPLETLYKYRDLSNRHFGDPEIFSKPLVLFMGPWSGGKSSIINYLLDNEYKQTSLRTGAEPSPAYFNILMHGEEEEILDGTQLAADWTFSGLQKFGQGMLDRLRGVRLNNPLLEKVNIVEIPGILEIRKQVQRLFPFNDACQWFIDRADIIFLVYDPAKLDVGPETEAILDQLKGREYQTRIILNKADQVKPEELMRVQGALIWNISPLMSSAEPPVMYSTSLWSIPYEAGAPTRLLYAQERAFLRDLRSAIDKRVEHKIASARRFAVRVRNHAKMVDCYLTTYYNHKGFFGNKKEISDKIIQNPQDYHIYEGLSTLTNISRYDLPDPEVYKDFFRLNPLYDFQQLSATCTYFRGCPINRLDVAIAYDLPELVGKYKKSVEAALHEEAASTPPS